MSTVTAQQPKKKVTASKSHQVEGKTRVMLEAEPELFTDLEEMGQEDDGRSRHATILILLRRAVKNWKESKILSRTK